MSGVCSEVHFNVFKLLWTVLLVTFSPAMSGNSTVAKSLGQNPFPEFQDVGIREMEALQGQTTILPCTVRNLGDKVVSWIRSKDLHILTSGPFSFSSDDRFEPVQSEDSWSLRIRGVQLSDSGFYECQINTDPKMSMSIKLSVLKRVSDSEKWVGRASIKGVRDVYAKEGSAVSLICEISPLTNAHFGRTNGGILMSAKPQVRWMHHNKELLFEHGGQSRFVLETEYGDLSQKIIGKLTIPRVSWLDSGQYTCFQMSVKSDTVRLITVQSEHSEAMQRDFPMFSASFASDNQHDSITCLLLCLSFVLNI